MRKNRTHRSLLTLENSTPIQMGFWVPNRVWATVKYLIPLRKYITKKRLAGELTPMQPVMQTFKDWVTHHSVYRMWVNSMIEQSNDYINSLDEDVKEQIRFDNDQYADGGTVNNYPMQVFDQEKYVSNKSNFKDGINTETLGCHLFSDGDGTTKPVKFGLVQYIIDLMKTLLDTQEITFNNTPNLVARSANISDCGISAIDFDIEAGDAQYNKLFDSGESGMTDYLSKYS